MSEANICPRTKRSCGYQTFCETIKETLERGEDTPAGALIEALPEPIRDAIKDSGACVNDRIDALTQVAEDYSGSGDPIRNIAAMMAARTIEARNMFPTAETV